MKRDNKNMAAEAMLEDIAGAMTVIENAYRDLGSTRGYLNAVNHPETNQQLREDLKQRANRLTKAIREIKLLT